MCEIWPSGLILSNSLDAAGRPSRFGWVFDKLDCNKITVDPEVVYRCSAPHRGPSIKLISAEELDKLAKQPSSSDFNVGNLRREIRKTEKIPGTEDLT